MLSQRAFLRLLAPCVALWGLFPFGGHADVSARRIFRSILPQNPAIVALLEDVSPDTLRAYLETLVGFYTRHSNSDTSSPTVGIGAARNWVFGRFAHFARAAGSPASPSFFEFDATICGIRKRHKNVLLTLVGSVSPERHFIVSGHMDSRTTSGCDSVSFGSGVFIVRVVVDGSIRGIARVVLVR